MDTKKYVGKSNDGQTLGDRCKKYESETEIFLPKEDYVIIRLDGKGFSKYTKGFDRPFDVFFSEAMQATTRALCAEFGAVTGYTQSDEITLVLAPSHGKLRGDSDINNQIYAGRVTKLASLTAGFASAYFDRMMRPYTGKLAWFDSRVYSVSSREEVANSIIWRGRDAIKNSKGMFASTYCSHKDLLNKHSQEQVDFCLKTTGMDWYPQPDVSKYGALVKKQQVMKYVEYIDAKVLRKEYVVLSVPLNTFSGELVDLLTIPVLPVEES